ncbi:MAG: head GIN domain-containing protein [Pelolinea sp.]|nr:head GIN domain-containing protein [Pelolinea sp.]
MAERKTEIRELGDFTQISMRGIGKIFVDQGKQQKVEIEGDDIVVSRIITIVKDGKLVIDVGRDFIEKLSAGFDFLSSNDIRMYITVKELEKLEITGAADVEVKEIKAKDLALTMTGASNVKVTGLEANILKAEMPGAGKIAVDGKVNDLFVTLTGAGNFSGHKLKSKTAKVVLSGVGRTQLWVTGELDVTITGIGSVEYYGNPHIKKSVTMLGKITSLGDPK